LEEKAALKTMTYAQNFVDWWEQAENAIALLGKRS
jgi:hypothetical protein